MSSALRYLLVGFLLLLIWGTIFIATTPVQFALDKIAIPPQIRLESAAGTVWNGRAQISYRDREKIQLPVISTLQTKLSWHWCPFYGLIAACIQLENSELQGEINLSYSLTDRSIAIRETALRFQIQDFSLKPYRVPLDALGAVGRLDIHNMTVPIDASRPRSLLADGELNNVRSGELEFGSYTLASQIDNSLLSVDFRGGGENFDIEGKFESEIDKSTYRYSADLRSTDETLLTLLKKYASESKGGQVNFSGKGKFRSFR